MLLKYELLFEVVFLLIDLQCVEVGIGCDQLLRKGISVYFWQIPGEFLQAVWAQPELKRLVKKFVRLCVEAVGAAREESWGWREVGALYGREYLLLRG